MSKFIGFINQGIKHFFIIDGEYFGDSCNEFKNGLPDSFTDSQLVAVLVHLSEEFAYGLVVHETFHGREKDLILNNRVVRFISGISMEVYLCHMVMFRVVERVHLERFITDGDMLYVLTCVMVVAGAVAFSWFMKKYTIPRLVGIID